MREKEREIQILDERRRERYKFGRLKYNRKIRKRKQRKENVKLNQNVQSMHKNERFNCSFREIVMQKTVL